MSVLLPGIESYVLTKNNVHAMCIISNCDFFVLLRHRSPTSHHSWDEGGCTCNGSGWLWAGRGTTGVWSSITVGLFTDRNGLASVLGLWSRA